MIASGCEIHKLPSAGEIGWKFRNGDIFNQHAEQALVETMREVEFLHAPARTQPCAGNEEQHCLAAVRRLVECALPTFARDDAALGVEIEENVVPSLTGKPVAQRNRLAVIGA